MKISVIVPIYNSEQYIDRCIKSILKQSYTNFELILVDDGSTDNSLKKITEYAKTDNRVKVYSQKNLGPGAARNLGLEKITGDYVVFIDSDDYIDEDYFKLLSEKNEDVVFINVNQVDENLNLLKEEHMSKYVNNSKDQILRKQLTGKIPWGGVRKAVKSDLISSYNIRYSCLQVGEEALYSFLVLYYANNFSIIDKPVYYYINRSDSQSSKKNDDPWGPVCDVIKDQLKKLNIYDKYSNTLNSLVITSLIISIYRISCNYSYKKYRVLAKTVINNYKNKIDKNYSVDFSSLRLTSIVLYPFVKMKLLTFIYVLSKVRK